jgi:hypothetical protein
MRTTTPTSAWTCLWPGLSALWVRGRWSGLVVAAAFAALVNFALIVTLAAGLLPAAGLSRWPIAAGTWILVVGLWVLGIRFARQELSRPDAQPHAAIDNSLHEAQTHYLKAHWIESETLVRKLLVERPDDVEGRLLLATILRRTGRAAAAQRLLTELTADPAAAHWRWEIECELARMTGEGKDEALARNQIQRAA